MASKNSRQMITGKSFEYSLLVELESRLKDKTNLEVIKNNSFQIAKSCFESTSKSEQAEYLLSASFAINFLIDIEPRLSNSIGKKDTLQLEILSDQRGKQGDVRDVLAIRLLQKWEIGISAKNNHHAVKHSRLSANIDFGNKWLGFDVSKKYFDTVVPIFNGLEQMRIKDPKKRWSDLGDYHKNIYIPILNAFIAELKYLYEKNQNKVATNLVAYLVGNKDFYKVIKSKNGVEVHAYNINGTLNLPINNVVPKHVMPRVPLPTKIVDISMRSNSDTTAIVKMNNEWVLSFRIHNASTKVEPSLKFDITLLKSPKKMFKNTLNISKN